MIDFHTHILPEMDDGSRDLEETKKLLQMEYEQGIRHIVATSHFYAQEEFPEKFLKRRDRRMQQVKDMLEGEEWGLQMHLYSGAEVLYYTGISESPDLPALCLEKTDTLLLELPFQQWDMGIYQEVEKMIEVRRRNIVLAHIERYIQYQKNPDIWNEILKLPVYIQLNAGNILLWRRRGLCKKLLKSGLPVLLGSDCHNVKKRPPELQKARAVVKRIAGREVLEQIDRLGEQVLGL